MIFVWMHQQGLTKYMISALRALTTVTTKMLHVPGGPQNLLCLLSAQEVQVVPAEATNHISSDSGLFHGGTGSRCFWALLKWLSNPAWALLTGRPGKPYSPFWPDGPTGPLNQSTCTCPLCSLSYSIDACSGEKPNSPWVQQIQEPLARPKEQIVIEGTSHGKIMTLWKSWPKQSIIDLEIEVCVEPKRCQKNQWRPCPESDSWYHLYFCSSIMLFLISCTRVHG